MNQIAADEEQPSKRNPARSRRGQFVMVRFALFDAFLAAALNPTLILMYIAIRTYVWRSDRSSHRLLALVNERALAVRIRQTKLAKLLGITRGRANVLVGQMVDLGWIKLDEYHRGRERICILGRVAKGRRKYKELYFFDAWAEAHADRLARARAGGASDASLIKQTAEIIAERLDLRSAGHDVSCSQDKRPANVSRGSDTKKREGLERKKKTNVQNPVHTSPSASFRWWIPRQPNEVFDAYRRWWEARARRPMDAEYAAKTRGEFDDLVRRVGPDEARRAFDVAINQRWIVEPVGILKRPELYEKHIAPRLSARARGEQSEWTGPRGDESGSRVVSAREFLGMT